MGLVIGLGIVLVALSLVPVGPGYAQGDGRQDTLVPVAVRGPNGRGTLSGVVQLAAGGGYTLALTRDSRVVAWGENSNGQLGDGTRSLRPVPVYVKGLGGRGTLRGVVAVAAGAEHSLALLKDGTVLAWGYNAFGQLGDGTTETRLSPVVVKGLGGSSPLSGVIDIAAGGDHSLALLKDGRVAGWGFNGFGQLGDGTRRDRSTPVLVTGLNGRGELRGVRSLSAGRGHSLALLGDGGVVAWGDNGFGQLGNGSRRDETHPAFVQAPSGRTELDGVQAIATGDEHSLARLTNGSVVAWGNNSSGQLGDGTNRDRTLPATVNPAPGGSLRVVAVAAGGFHSMALLANDTIQEWGEGISRQPTQTAPAGGQDGGHRALTHPIAVAAGGLHCLAIDASGSVFAWGDNSRGQLGIGG